MTFARSDFGEGFVFGAATSSYQIEGHAFGGAGASHWDSFAATPGNVARGENGAVACDHYHRFGEDLDLVASAGFDAYRFSTSWARVQPEGSGAPNEAGLDFYDRLADAAQARGLKPFATLYHWELPAPLADLGGWTNRDVALRFGDFAEIIMKRIGDRMHAVAPINEPWCVAWLSHFLGQHAPGLRDVRAATRAMHHVMLAHGTAIGAMRALGMNNLGAVPNHEYVEPADDSDSARGAAELYDAIYNRWLLDGIRHKRCPPTVEAALEPHFPAGWQDDFDIIGAPLDWLGLNYYTRKLIADAGSGLIADLVEVEGPLPKTTMGWEIYPEGLYHFLKRTQDEYADGLPIYVTENGMSSDDRVQDGRVADPARIAYLLSHLDQVRRAQTDGVNVAGYFAWSLLDNYEWALGYEKRFGLVHVDFETLKRTPKDSHAMLAEALRR